MEPDKPEKVDSINISELVNEVDWDDVIRDILKRADGENVPAPYVYYEALGNRVKWVPATIIHEN